MMDFGYVVNVEGAVVDARRYLMIVRGDQETHAAGTLSLPGGKLEYREAQNDVLEQTLRRELREEVGIEVDDDMEYVESKFFVADDGAPVVDVVFLCRYLAGTPAIGDPGEIAALQWMTAEEVLQHPRTPAWTHRSVRLAEQKRKAKRQ